MLSESLDDEILNLVTYMAPTSPILSNSDFYQSDFNKIIL